MNRKKSKPGAVSRFFKSVFQEVDLFKMDVSFRENGEDSFSSTMGVIISICILVLIAVYGHTKFMIFLDYGDSTFMEYRDVNVRNKEDILGYEDMNWPFGAFSIRFNAFNNTDNTKTYASNKELDIDALMDLNILLHDDYIV